MKNKQNGSTKLVALGLVAFWLTVVVGWGINLVEVITQAAADAPVTTLFIVKAAGIVVAPIGVVCGLFF